MNRIILWIAAVLTFALQSCEKTDDLRAEIDSLGERVMALEKQVGEVNANIVALHKLLDKSTLIVGVTPNEMGYVLELSDGTKLPVILGQEIPALVPVLGIDAEGYWIYSLDKGVTFSRLFFNGKPLPAWPQLDGESDPGVVGITPKLKVDAEGYWLVSLDGGKNYESLLQDGQKVNALGANVSVAYSGFFKSVVYDKAKGTLSIELLDGQKLTLPIEDTFGLKVTAGSDEIFFLEDTRVFEVEQRGVKEAIVKVPTGWKATLDEAMLTVTSPASARLAEQPVELSVIVTSEKGYLKTATLRVKLLNKKRDADACLAWQKFQAGAADNVLLDYSYAGYMHGELAPPEVAGLGYKVYDVTKYGADPTGKNSSREALLTLLKELKLTGQSESGSNLANPNAKAIIYFPAGRYILHDEADNVVDPSSANQIYRDSKGNNKSVEIQIRGGNFVLKGAGRDQTVLVMDSPNLPNTTEMWSSPMMLNIKNNGSSDTKLTNITGDSPVGSFSVTAGLAAGISAGDWVMLKLSNNDPTLVAQELAPHRVEGNMTDIQTILVEDYHQVRSVSGNVITFYEPLMHAVEAKWNWELHRFPHYENVGVEDLAFEGKAKPNFVHHGSWEDDGAYKPLNMMRLTNSWIRRVDFKSVSEAASIVASANCSAYDIEISGNGGHSGVRSQSASRIFIGKIYDHSDVNGMANAGQYHASGVSNTSMGAVLWNNTWGDDSFFESHAKQPRATLVDRCKGSFVQGHFGGDETNVPNHLRKLTIWNMEATRVAYDGGVYKWWISADKWWKTMPPIIVGLHGAGPVVFDESADQIEYLESNGTRVQPESLYEAQLRERLGYVPAWLNSLK